MNEEDVRSKQAARLWEEIAASMIRSGSKGLAELLAQLPQESADGLPEAIEAAQRWGSDEALEMLLAHNASLKEPLSVEDLGLAEVMNSAIFSNRESSVQILASHGAANMKTVKGNLTPLMAAAMYDSFECFEALLFGGADPAVVVDGNTALFFAAITSPRALNLLKDLVDVQGACIPTHTALMVSACFVGGNWVHGNAESCAILAPLSDPLKMDKDGRTALMMAVKHGAWDCANILEPFGGPLALPEEAEEALKKATKDGRVDWIAKLEQLALSGGLGSPCGKAAKPRL